MRKLLCFTEDSKDNFVIEEPFISLALTIFDRLSIKLFNF